MVDHRKYTYINIHTGIIWYFYVKVVINMINLSVNNAVIDIIITQISNSNAENEECTSSATQNASISYF